MSRSLLPAAQISAAGFLWGTTGVVVSFVHRTTGMTPIAIGFARLAIAAAVLLVVNPRSLRAIRSEPTVLLLIGTGLGVYQALYFIAVAQVGVAVATVVSLGLAPVLLAGWESVRASAMPSRRTILSVLAAVTGLALITGGAAAPAGAGPRPLLGLLAAIGSGLGYAATTALSREISRRIDPMTLTTVSTSVGAVVLLPLIGGSALPGGALPTAMLIYLGVMATALAYALFYAGLRTTTGSAAVVLTLLEPLTAAALAVLLLGEPLSASITAGGGLLLGAVLLMYAPTWR